jgi:hypothetical protein
LSTVPVLGLLDGFTKQLVIHARCSKLSPWPLSTLLPEKP